MQLTQREMEICHYISLGLNNKQIAQIMNISIHTVKAHLSHLFFNNQNIKNRTQLAYILGKENIV